MNTIAGSRYPLMFGQGTHKPTVRAATINKNTDKKHASASTRHVTEQRLKANQYRKSLSKEKYSHNQGTRKYPSKQSKTGHSVVNNTDKVSFRGGRPFGQVHSKPEDLISRPVISVGGQSKVVSTLSSGIGSGKPPGRHTAKLPAKNKVLQQSNTRVKFVKELIREEAALDDSDPGSTVPITSRISSVNVNPHGVGPQVRASPLAVDHNGQLTINLYVQPETKESTSVDGTDGESLISGGRVNKQDNTKSEVATIPGIFANYTAGRISPNAIHHRSINSPRKEQPAASVGDQIPLREGQIPVDSHTTAVIPSPRRPTIDIDGSNNTVKHGHSQSHTLHFVTSDNNFMSSDHHLATGVPGEDSQSFNAPGYPLAGVESVQRQDYEYFSDYDNSPVDRWATSGAYKRLGVTAPASHYMDRHQYQYYPQAGGTQANHRAEFEQRLDDHIQRDMRYRDPTRYTEGGRATPDNLKKLSAKHYLSSKSRLDSRDSSLPRSPPHYDHSRRMDHRDDHTHKSVHTNTGHVQYLMRNKNKRDTSSISSISTIHMEKTLPDIPTRGQQRPPENRKRTKRVKDSDAQTELNGEDISEMDELLPPVQEISTQTQQPRSVLTEDKEISLKRKEQIPKSEIGIQVNEKPKEVSTQTRDVPKTVSTSTEDLLPTVPVKMGPKSPRHPEYKSQSLYKQIRSIIDEEASPDRAPNKTDSGYHDEDESRFENFDEDDDSVLGDVENEVYVLYLRTESGALIGPLQLTIHDAMFGLPDKSADEQTSTGLRNRATGANSVNEHSSRSHSMLTLNIDSELQDPDDENLYITKHGKLTFVDLAGSEKTKTDTVTSQEHLVESNNINRSLLVLGNCISALGDSRKRNGHIPYRDSKLTKLLADSLGGSGVTLMIACVSPSAYNSAETMNTLRYANRAKKIKTKPYIRMDPRERLIVSLKREVKVLRQENHYLRQQLDFPVKPRGQLQKENDQKFLQMLKEYKKEGKINDHGLYEMLQEYMIENETLRSENTDLHSLRDQGRRDQQTLARENERLIRKLDLLEKERMLVNTPISIYSVGSTISRRSSGVESQFDGAPSNWQQQGGAPPPNQYNRDTPRNKKKTPPSHLQHPQRPPHRLSEPVNKNNPGYLDSPRNNGYANRYNNQQDYYRNNPNPQAGPPGAPIPHQGASYPQPKPSNTKPRETQGGGGYAKGAPKPSHSQEAPLAQPRKSKGAVVPPSWQEYKPPMAQNNYDYMEDDEAGESTDSMNDRLRQELLDLEGQIKKQTRMSGPPQQSPTRTRRAVVPPAQSTRR